ncbi:hypothetical protein K7I13_08205 [Brucepastera parasyntrophica]|uniref:COG1470 family protein n=1 Tax=Brucepastera parasyntrophica TaxID=2880008 RepID=UPI00210C3A05|nr:hypothetical protein [Brucepastera parasyntrophica]ULQ58555.1 hypothetical protein K7I13_08205 [Brucepastera parasyntrophica]
MKRLFILLVFVSLCFSAGASEETRLIINLSYPRTIRSAKLEVLQLTVTNDGDTAINNLELTVSENDVLNITLDNTRIDRIGPRKSAVINMEISDTDPRYFPTDSIITIRAASGEFEKDQTFRITIKPVEYFWFRIIICVVIALVILLAIVFIRLNREETENDREST